MDHKLFTVIVLCYRHFEYLYSAIDSVLLQDYPNIELIVSDDGSPNFPQKKLEEYIAQKKGDNIKFVVVRQQGNNSGTVKHLNDAISVSRGSYVISLSGDDNLYNAKVLSSYVHGFEEAPPNCYIEMAHSGMYDESLQTLQSYYLKPDVQQAIEATATDSSALLEALIRLGACLPSTSTCFKREFFEQFGSFDESYSLVEDFPMHIRLAKEKWIIHYVNFVAIKHRHGGISHGQIDTLSRSKVLYYEDSIRLIDNLTLKNLSVLSPKEREKVTYRKKRERDWMEFLLARSERDLKQMFTLALRHPVYSFAVLLQGFAGIARKVYFYLFCLALSCGICGDTLASMLETVSLGHLCMLPSFFSKLSSGMMIACFLCVIGMSVHSFLQKIQIFPTNTLLIG